MVLLGVCRTIKTQDVGFCIFFEVLRIFEKVLIDLLPKVAQLGFWFWTYRALPIGPIGPYGALYGPYIGPYIGPYLGPYFPFVGCYLSRGG